MAAVQQKLVVHKQFNSPLGLYSPQNIQATLDRELKAFGMNDRCNGIDNDEKVSMKPLNLANSAVLRAVEEEEEEMKCGYKRVAWPPMSEERIAREFTPQPQGQFPPSQQQSPSPQMTTRAAGVTSPNTPQQPLQQQQQQLYPQDYRSDSPGIITLRKEAPISQKPAPVFTSQPAAVSFRGGSKMRGDLKWPPPEYKEQIAREEEERHQLQMGPAVRPTKIKRDYTDFFAKHRLNSYYPSYKVPPGTQHMTA